MRGSLVVLALAVSPLVARASRAQTTNASPVADSVKCLERTRGNPSDSGAANRADPTTRGNKSCIPPVVGHTSVSGFVFFDVIQNGVFDADEVGLSGWQVDVLAGTVIVQSTTTLGDGSYSITGLNPGTYTLCVSPPIGWVQTGPTSGPTCPNGTIGVTIVAPSQATDTSLTGVNLGFISA